MVAALQSENKNLRSQLQSLQHVLDVHRSRARSVYDTKRDLERKFETSRDKLRHTEGLRDHLVLIHCDSIRGPRAMEYRAVYREYILLQDQFRGAMVDHMLVQYRLQKLIIDITQTREHARSQVVLVLPMTLVASPLTWFFRLLLKRTMTLHPPLQAL